MNYRPRKVTQFRILCRLRPFTSLGASLTEQPRIRANAWPSVHLGPLPHPTLRIVSHSSVMIILRSYLWDTVIYFQTSSKCFKADSYWHSTSQNRQLGRVWKDCLRSAKKILAFSIPINSLSTIVISPSKKIRRGHGFDTHDPVANLDLLPLVTMEGDIAANFQDKKF